MNTRRETVTVGTSIGKGPIPVHYEKGLLYFADGALLSLCPSKKKDERAYDASEIVDYQNLAREQLLLGLSHTGTCEEQRIKIKAALLLVKLSDIASETAKGYFYDAVEIASRYLGENFYDREEGEAIVKCYLSSIDPDFKTRFIDQNIASFLPLLKLIIRSESERRKIDRIQAIREFYTHSGDDTSHEELLHHLAGAIGPFRLHIISEGSGVCIADHQMTDHPIAPAVTLTFPIFDRSKGYHICIDRGSSEEANQFSEEERRAIIYPLLGKYIQKKEYTLFEEVDDNIAETDNAENHMDRSISYDYRSFIGAVIADFDVTSRLHNGVQSVESLSRAVDICRVMTFATFATNASPLGDIPATIDRLLAGRVQRHVLQRVTSLLLTRNEMTSGTGYPYGLTQKNIPLEGRIYKVIRAYEAIRVAKLGHHKGVISLMEDWSREGYLDADIWKIFLEHYRDEPPRQIKQGTPDIHPVLTPRRRMRYESYITKWQTLLVMMKNIEESYITVRRIAVFGHSETEDKAKRSELFLLIKKLQGRLREEAGIRKIIYLTRHGQTRSDVPGGPPGSDDEVLTEAGKMSGRMIGDNMRGLHFHIRTSPLARAVQYAEIICHQVRGCIAQCLDCPYISSEKILINPDKSKDTERYGSLALKIMTDTEGLPEYLVSHISSSDESMMLMVSHRDVIVQLRFWIENLFDETSIQGQKYPVLNDAVVEIYVQGTHVMTEEEQKKRGLLFSRSTWKSSVAALRAMTKSTFGEVFHDAGVGGVNLIELHDQFLDFLDFHADQSPEQIRDFLDELDRDLSTVHFGEILRSAGFSLSSSQETT